MTLIIGIKDGNKGCIISDFRITNTRTGNQSDNAMKYTHFDNRLFIMMAGKTVDLLPEIEAQLPTIMTSLTYENVDTEHGPLTQVLHTVFSGKAPSFDSPMIGVYLDQRSNSFKMFRIDTVFDTNSGTWSFRYVPDSVFSCEIIGSGDILLLPEFFPSFGPLDLFGKFSRGINLDVLNTSINPPEITKYDIPTIADGIIKDVSMRLQSLGPIVYRSLGISPNFMSIIIEGSYLEIQGSDNETAQFDIDGEYTVGRYSFERRREGAATLIDHSTGQRVAVDQTDSDFSPSNLANNTFDPENRSEENGLRPFQFTLKQVITSSAIIRIITETRHLTYAMNEFPVRQIAKKQEKSKGSFDVTHVPEQPLLDTFVLDSWDQIDLFDIDWIESNIGPASVLFQIEDPLP